MTGFAQTLKADKCFFFPSFHLEKLPIVPLDVSPDPDMPQSLGNFS